ncbi:hypothetical protein ABZ614_40165 [Streptomyces sp. NPDC013178]|uniref:hypothetical protein n=1 Tax=Streptomyces sp. NPDC013178 TaxID=3155118 RepID=UPI0033C4A9BE
MSDAIERAAREAVEAADNTEMVKQIAAILAAQQLLNQQQPTVAQQATTPFDAKKWLVIGGVVVAGGLVASLFAVAIAIGAVCATACLLILRGLWADFQKNR